MIPAFLWLNDKQHQQQHFPGFLQVGCKHGTWILQSGSPFENWMWKCYMRLADQSEPRGLSLSGTTLEESNSSWAASGIQSDWLVPSGEYPQPWHSGMLSISHGCTVSNCMVSQPCELTNGWNLWFVHKNPDQYKAFEIQSLTHFFSLPLGISPTPSMLWLDRLKNIWNHQMLL